MPAFFDRGFTVREPAWHGLAHVFDDYPGREEAMRVAGHDFTVVEQPLYLPPLHVPEDGDVELSQVRGWKALVREDQPDTVFHLARKTYGVIQPETVWDVVDAIVGQPNVKYETAGVLKDGAILWVLAWLDEPATVPGDDSPIYPFVCVSTTFDGSAAMMARNVSIRVVCWNTFSAAEVEAERTGREFTFRHTANVMDRIEEAKVALQGVRADHQTFITLAHELAALPITRRARDFFVNEFIPMPPELVISDRVVGNVEQARQKVRNLLDSSKTVNNGNGAASAWDLLQAGTEYLDHLRGYRSKETYFGRQLLRPEPFKSKLIPLVREAATIGA